MRMNTKVELEKINHDNKDSNMFGILPCPKCKSMYRWPTQTVHVKHPNSIICDDCGYVVKIEKDTDDK